ncbi:sigma-70 family RNA polymerase sigma factor [Luteolibacter yonseiensis]|uniref:Sigma-70 family RNA polymerase sigma factor n=1 Tax=Luteolibacter yonseiensis TaxID=1144680 RepID=A0A934V7B9_9BACT|nr:sigma-70 family RNA polymerase sigma factor [Luteolibacter yonseiensis]MBK1815977.1 sigma-70 family RNA polymerase sigma factor [Luteolibacter yonseiensis]
MKVEPPSIDATREHLHRFAASGCDVSFRALFDSHAGLVYHAALRTGRGDRQLAEDVVQTVFTSLARKASTFSSRIILPAWLHRHACLTTRQMMRSTRRRQIREEASALLRQDLGGSSAVMAELIDEALNSLSHPDRVALVLRFLENKDLRSVGRELGISEDAAQKRVSRGLDRLRSALGRRGVGKSFIPLAGTFLSGQAGAVPSGLGSLAAASLQAVSVTAPAFPAVAGAIACFTMKKSTIVLASVLAALTGTALVTTTQWRRPGPASASTGPVPAKSNPAKPLPAARQGPDPSGVVEPPSPRSTPSSKGAGRLEITTTKGPHFPTPPASVKPFAEYDQATRDAFRSHPLTKVAQDRLNAMRSVTQRMLNQMTAVHKEKLALYQTLLASSNDPGLNEAGRAEVEARMRTLSAGITQGEQEQADFKAGMNEMLNRNLAASTERILEKIENPASEDKRPEPNEAVSFNTGEALFLSGDYAAAENTFAALADSSDPRVATFSQWKVMLTRMLQGKDNTNEIQPLLLGSVSSACYAMAAHSIQQGGWEEAAVWIEKAKSGGSPEDNVVFNDPLVEMGWMDQATGLLIPPDQ